MNGPTDLDNLALVCNAHHHQIHDDGWILASRHTDSGLRWTLTPPRPNAGEMAVDKKTPCCCESNTDARADELVGVR
jgi:hypothetical protein